MTFAKLTHIRTAIAAVCCVVYVSIAGCAPSSSDTSGLATPASGASPSDSVLIYEDSEPSVPPLFVAVGDAVYTSVDGIRWNAQPISIRDEATVAYGNGRAVIVGQGGRLIIGDSWLRWRQISPEIKHLTGTLSVAYGNDRFVAVGTALAGLVTATGATSPDGINWTPTDASHLFGGLSSVAYGEGKFVGVGHGFVATSSDGTVWIEGVRRSSDFFGQLFDVAYGNGKFVAVGGRGSIYGSRGGINWGKGRADLSDVFFVRGVTYGNGIFVAVGDERVDKGTFVPGEGYGLERPMSRSAIISSRDGVNWRIQHTSTSQTLADIAYGGNQFVVIGENEGPSDRWGRPTSYNSVVLTSNNGADWTATEVGGLSVQSEDGPYYVSTPDDPRVWLSSVSYWPDASES